jgi:XisI protein
METLNFQKIIIVLLSPLQFDKISYGELRKELLFDFERQRFSVFLVGWRGLTRFHSILIDIAIRDGLVWLEEDNTELEIANLLVERGIPNEKIVLGFHAPYKRPYTGFAVG